ncbi:MAG: hypothetical protein IJV11_02465, partial [Muribaculaceae bacterium]|nr:hypothetical protein [Muribaculaceae bacterium]
LATEHDRAYRDLLLTQARYRAYVTATSDSDINRAVAYFADCRPIDREKLTRAYIYKGAVMDELGHPDSAMLYYKHAEATAAPDDYFNLGYVNLRIAELYQKVFFKDSAVVSRMKVASGYFNAISDSALMMTTIGTQGLYDEYVGIDSAMILLNKAISLGRKLDSSSRFFYQSKLAGIYFYNKDYNRAKDLSLDIILNGDGYCDEDQYFYYAARSYVKLNLIDSAVWVMSMIPPPLNAVDSMNMHLLMADIAQFSHKYQQFAYHSHIADSIDKHMLRRSAKSLLTDLELNYDAHQREKALAADSLTSLILVICICLLIIAVIIILTFLIIRRMISKYEAQLGETRTELEKLIGEIHSTRLKLESERRIYRHQLFEKNNELAASSKRCRELEQMDKSVAAIVRYRLAALNEIYENIRIKSTSEDVKKRQLTLVSTVKELYEKRGILHKQPKASFWDNLKLSLDGEYEGLVTFIEKNYPNLTEKDLHLFMLSCADFPNPIIKICMNLTSDVTVSKNKKKLMKEKIGLDMRIADFIQMFLEGKIPH